MSDLMDARVPLVEQGEAAAEVAELYARLLADRGVVPNMFKALANVPGLARGIAALLKPLMGEGALAGWYKELIASRAAWLNDCAYCVSAHRYLAGQRGATAAQIAGYEAFEEGPFTEKEKAGFRYAEVLHAGGNAVDDAAFAAASRHFDAREMVELTAVAAAFEFFPRFNSALRIPVTPLPPAR